jgi:AraC-like DNA-binding protein
MHAYHRHIKGALMYPWSKRTLFLGALPAPVQVAYGAATLIVSLGGPICFTAGKRVARCHSFVIPAGLSVTIDARSETVAICHLDVLGEDYLCISGCLRDESEGIGVELCDEADFRDQFTSLYNQPASSDDAYQRLDRLLEYGYANGDAASVIDGRITHVVARIKQCIQENLPVCALAEEAQLSVPRLVQLFKLQTGVPIRRFRLWHRMYESVISIGRGENFTDAALNAGFSDLPHYSNYFCSMWGVPPSRLFGKGTQARIFLPSGPNACWTAAP